MSDLLVPVYLNQRIVFDLIAILEDGIATVTRLTSTEESAGQESRSLGGSFGLTEALSSLLRVSVEADQGRSASTGSSAMRSEERIHTPASLFHKLRNRLRSRKELVAVEDDYVPKPGDIIEFSSSLHRNPLLQTLDAFDGLIEVSIAFSDPEPPNQKKSNRKQRQSQPVGERQLSRSEFKRLREQVATFSAGVRAGDTVDIVSKEIGNGFGAVITLHQEYLNEPTMADLVDGKFTVVGKVVRVVELNDGGINLLRKSALSAMSPDALAPMFSSMSEIEGFNLPKLEMEVTGPVVQIIPIAVYA